MVSSGPFPDSTLATAMGALAGCYDATGRSRGGAVAAGGPRCEAGGGDGACYLRSCAVVVASRPSLYRVVPARAAAARAVLSGDRIERERTSRADGRFKTRVLSVAC